MKYTDKERINIIIDKAEKLNNYLIKNKISKQDVILDYALQWLITTPLYNIGEQVYNLSAEFKTNHNQIPWHMIAGLRHRLIHDYEGTNWNIIVEVIFDELPIFIEQLKKIME